MHKRNLSIILLMKSFVFIENTNKNKILFTPSQFQQQTRWIWYSVVSTGSNRRWWAHICMIRSHYYTKYIPWTMSAWYKNYTFAVSILRVAAAPSEGILQPSNLLQIIVTIANTTWVARAEILHCFKQSDWTVKECRECRSSTSTQILWEQCIFRSNSLSWAQTL